MDKLNTIKPFDDIVDAAINAARKGSE